MNAYTTLLSQIQRKRFSGKRMVDVNFSLARLESARVLAGAGEYELAAAHLKQIKFVK